MSNQTGIKIRRRTVRQILKNKVNYTIFQTKSLSNEELYEFRYTVDNKIKESGLPFKYQKFMKDHAWMTVNTYIEKHTSKLFVTNMMTDEEFKQMEKNALNAGIEIVNSLSEDLKVAYKRDSQRFSDLLSSWLVIIGTIIGRCLALGFMSGWYSFFLILISVLSVILLVYAKIYKLYITSSRLIIWSILPISVIIAFLMANFLLK